MQERMEQRRKEWDDDVSKLRMDFFRLKPDEMQTGSPGNSSSSSSLLEKMDLQGMFYDVKDGTKVFRVSFDVSQFSPDEINVKTQDNKLIVQAKHEEKGGDKTISREFSRQVDIPSNVDPLKLQSTLSKDGILQVEAPVCIPTYDTITSTVNSGNNLERTTTQHPVTFTDIKLSNIMPGLGSALDKDSCISEQEGKKIFRIAIDIGTDFVPDDLMVKTVDRKLSVHAKHQEVTATKTSCKEFSREFDLPDTVDPNTVTASLTAEGRLLLEAPVVTSGSTNQPPNVDIHFRSK
ncbi:hypothetical protein HELRODRAFT_106514 [Helobdella robusta]|uniref:SHSP domain-containing protein n=1 Tax=Helobdella robusta TaxID=6412 RepID=T1EE30_HELRO|nr:hypothetical protein HELRODRAFT_106514 [Helobdella robusta]ESO02197.1 hypothetical protein HELRODRAFT_106514 [Helobdella robusta]